MKSDSLTEKTCLNRISIWLRAISDQILILREAHKINDQMRIHYTSYFVALSLNRLRGYLLEYQKKRSSRAPEFDRILSELEMVKSFRDVREHEKEYLKGEGKERGYYTANLASNIPFPLRDLRLDAHTNVIIGKDILLGGRVSIMQMERLMKKLDSLLILEINSNPEGTF